MANRGGRQFAWTLGWLVCACTASSAMAGTVTVVETNYVASVAKSLTVACEGIAKPCGLWAAWDAEDRGASTNGWAHVAFVQTVTSALCRYACALPSGWGGTDAKAMRFFLSEVPYDVDCTLASITSDGNQYLIPLRGPGQTVTLTGAAKVEMDCTLSDVSGTKPLFCSRGSSTSKDQFTLFVLTSSGTLRWRFDYNTLTGSSKTPDKSQAPKANVDYLITVSSAGLCVNGKKDPYAQECPTAAAAFTCAGALTVMAHHNGNTASPAGRTPMTLRSFKVADTAFTIDLVPAMKGGVVGMYDVVSGQFTGPSGSGSFTAGTRNEAAEPFIAASDCVGDIPDATGRLLFAVENELADASAYANGVTGEKAGRGILTLTGANDFGGVFLVTDGLLAADFGQGLAATDNLKLVNGCLDSPSGSITALLGTGAGEIDLAGGAVGFSAAHGDLAVDLGGAADDVVVGGSEPHAADPFVLNDDKGTHTLTMMNRITAPGDLSIDVRAGRAVLTKGWSNAGDFVKKGDGTLELRGTVASPMAGAGTFYAYNGKVELLNGAAYTIATNFFVGAGSVSGSCAHLVVSNATFNLGRGWLYGQAGPGLNDDHMRIFIYGDSHVGIERFNISRGEVQIYGGAITTTDPNFGVVLGSLYEACRLYGGTLETKAVRCNGNGSAFEWRGGTVRARANVGTFFDNMASKTRVGKDGGVFDTQNYNVTITNVLTLISGDKAPAYSRATCMTVPAFRKDGTGTLTLTKAATYVCATEVHEGTLKLSGDGRLNAAGLLRMTGGTFLLNGLDQTVANLVGTGTIRGGGTLTVTGEALPGGPDGTGPLALTDGARLAGKVVLSVLPGGTLAGSLTGTVDLSDVDLRIAGSENLPKSGSLAIVQAASVSGMFKNIEGIPEGWRLVVNSRSVRLTNLGTMLIIR